MLIPCRQAIGGYCSELQILYSFLFSFFFVWPLDFFIISELIYGVISLSNFTMSIWKSFNVGWHAFTAGNLEATACVCHPTLLCFTCLPLSVTNPQLLAKGSFCLLADT